MCCYYTGQSRHTNNDSSIESGCKSIQNDRGHLPHEIHFVSCRSLPTIATESGTVVSSCCFSHFRILVDDGHATLVPHCRCRVRWNRRASSGARHRFALLLVHTALKAPEILRKCSETYGTPWYELWPSAEPNASVNPAAQKLICWRLPFRPVDATPNPLFHSKSKFSAMLPARKAST